MKNKARFFASMVVSAALVSGCASSPKSIEPAYVSPTKYQSYTCEQIGAEQISVEQRTVALYRTLKKRRQGDNVKMAVGLVVFWPVLFFLKGNNAKAAEFAQMKGEYEALRTTANGKSCGLQFRPRLEEAGEQGAATS